MPKAVEMEAAAGQPRTSGHMNAHDLKPRSDDVQALAERLRQAAAAATNYAGVARNAAARLALVDGALSGAAIDREQRAVHGFAWIATLAKALEAAAAWAGRLAGEGRLGTAERLALEVGFGEYLAQLVAALPMSQNEIITSPVANVTATRGGR